MSKSSQQDPIIQKANGLLAKKSFKKLRALLKKFPKNLAQEASEYELQILAEEGPPEALSKAFDRYLKSFDQVLLSNLEVAVRVKVDLLEYDKAMEIAERIFAEDPHNHTAVNAVFVVHVNRRNKQAAYDTAVTMLKTWTSMNKNEEIMVDANLKVVLSAVQLAKFYEALGSWEEVKDKQSSYPHLFASEHYACAIRTYSNLGMSDAALELIEGLDPEMARHPNIVSSMPIVWFNLGEKDRCYEAYEDMERVGIDPVETIWNRGLSRLGFGDIEDGLSDYEIRWKWDEFPSAKRVFTSPLWMGEDLTGKRILVWGEQGIGDQLLFLTLLPVVLSKNPAEVVVEVSKKIIPLVQRWYPEVTVGSDGVVDTIGHEYYEQFDCNIPAGTLMQRYVSEHGSIPTCQRQLRVPEGVRQKLFPQHIAEKRILIGVSWRSHLLTDARVGNYMSVQSIPKILKILPDDVGLISLQYSLNDDERELLSGYDNVFVPDHDFFEEVDFNALYAGSCDLVLTAGTVSLQLAGIYGVPVLTWLPDRDWVLLGGSRYPWFENVVVVRGAPDWNNNSMLNALIDKLKILLRLN
jgi:tetratricopeptide (TPR) repeat protein